MRPVKCPSCGRPGLARQVVPRYETRVGGVPVVVSDARIARCAHCGEIVVAAKEIRRWMAEQRAQLAARGHVPTPHDVTRIRRSLGLSVSGLAALVGVSRQTVHAWERPESGPMPLGPAALLLKLLDAQLQGGASSPSKWLMGEALRRGQRLGAIGRLGRPPRASSPHHVKYSSPRTKVAVSLRTSE